MANPLTLVIPLEESIDLGQLQAGLAALMPNIGAAMMYRRAHVELGAPQDVAHALIGPGPATSPDALGV